jgi:hypothetical protein
MPERRAIVPEARRFQAVPWRGPLTRDQPLNVDLGHSACDRLRIPRDSNQRSERMPIAIPKRVRVLDEVTDFTGWLQVRSLQ